MKHCIRLFAPVVMAFMVSACGAQLREPLCGQDELGLPPGAAGRYILTNVTSSAVYSGVQARLSRVEIELTDEADAIKVVARSSAKNPLGAFRGGATSNRRVESKTPGMDPIVLQSFKPCRVGDAYYSQMLASEGGYTISRFDLSATGITLVELLFTPEDLDAHGFRYHFMPVTGAWASDGQWAFDIFNPARLVVDNVGLTAERRAELLGLARTSPFGVVLSRLPDEARRPRAQSVTSVVIPK